MFQGWNFPVPGLITDLLLSMDDRFLYFSNWLHGDMRQYDITDPSKPKLIGQVWLGGVIGKPSAVKGITGWPADDPTQPGWQTALRHQFALQQLGTTSSTPISAKQGSWLMQIDCDTEKGGLKVNEKFIINFNKEPNGPPVPMRCAIRVVTARRISSDSTQSCSMANRFITTSISGVEGAGWLEE